MGLGALAVLFAGLGELAVVRFAPPPARDADTDALVAPLDPSTRDETVRAAGRFRRAPPPPGGVPGVVAHDPSRAFPGVDLYTSGHAPVAVLADLDGRVLHEWRMDFADTGLRAGPSADTHSWRRARLLEDGRLLALIDGVGVIALDADSNLLWAIGNRAHSDLDLLPDGRAAALTRAVKEISVISRSRAVVDDAFAALEADGRPGRAVPLIEAWLASSTGDWRPTPGVAGDLLRTSALEVLDGAHVAQDPAFAAGNVLLALRAPSRLAVLDPVSSTLVWSRGGSFVGPHDAHFLPDGRIVLFDGQPQTRASRILAIDPTTGAEEVLHEGTAGQPFFSRKVGAVQVLGNGNLLVTESDAGHAFERAPDGDVVWDFYSPHRSETNARLVATLFEVQRLPPEAAAWLER